MTVEEMRIELAKALVRVGAGEDEAALFQWHPCTGAIACQAIKRPPQPCPCAGSPYLSDAAWAELAPIIRRIQRGAAGVSTTYEEWRVTGDPGDGFPPYQFTWSAVGPPAWEFPEREARNFMRLIASVGDWPDGPHLAKRTVTVTEWTGEDMP